jgi:predicted amidohydrolase
MKICAAQIKPAPGDIEANLAKHQPFIERAVALGADLVFFPELSLTSYEPKLAAQLATTQEDARFNIFQNLSDAHNIIIGVGLPTPTATGTRISQILFQPQRARLTYSKQQLHADEMPYFKCGETGLVLKTNGHTLAPAICYESLQPGHAQQAANAGADVYLASVAKSERGLARAYAHYPAIARQHGLTVILSNALGACDDFVSAGQSAVWLKNGQLAGKLDGECEGLIMIDTLTGHIEITPVNV